MARQEVFVRAFTVSAPALRRELRSRVKVGPAFDHTTEPEPEQKDGYSALWDTGATGTVINQKVVDECGLKPMGMAEVHTAGGSGNQEVYLISVVLPNEVGFAKVRVTKADLHPSIDVLIGMDIISAGDFAVTNCDGKTCFSFRIPSVSKIDFCPPQKGTPIINPGKIGRNERCVCGSGKKYKHCCGDPARQPPPNPAGPGPGVAH